MQELGEVERMSMYNTFNMGIGMVLVVAPENVSKVMEIVEGMNDKAYVIGKITSNEKEVEICLK